jgi:hypothetical protein
MAKQQADAVTDAKRRGPESNPGAPDFAGAALPWNAGRCGAVAVPIMSICPSRTRPGTPTKRENTSDVPIF